MNKLTTFNLSYLFWGQIDLNEVVEFNLISYQIILSLIKQNLKQNSYPNWMKSE